MCYPVSLMVNRRWDSSEAAPLGGHPARVLKRVLARARPGSSVDDSWSNVALVSQILTWLGNVVRGSIALIGISGGAPRLCERGVIVHGRRNCRIGRWTILERGTTLRAHGGSGIQLGDGAVIGSFSILEVSSGLARNAGWIRIGNRTCLGDHSYVGGAGGVSLGDNVLCGQYVSFHSENHNFSDDGRLIREQGVTHLGIEVQDDCWIGAGATILDGVVIERGAVIGAGAVVTKSVSAFTIVGGVPARVIGSRLGPQARALSVNADGKLGES
jgi:acetyltransferase-like isoleucine patch superfamily enzyme